MKEVSVGIKAQRSLARKATKERHKDMVCRVFELKFDKSHMNKEQKEFLSLLFLEAKWFYNYCISCGELKDADTKAKTVPVKLQDGTFEKRPLKVLSAQIKQGIKDRIFSNIKTLHTLKMQGKKVGRIWFKSRVNSIPLRQHKNSCVKGTTQDVPGTHDIFLDKNLVTIVKAPKPFKVNGINQIPRDAEIANARLLHKDGDYFLQVICYINKDQDYINEQYEINKARKDKVIGFDFGCTTQLTGMDNDGNGFKVEFEVPIDKGIRRLDRNIDRKLDKKTSKKQRKSSRNRNKDLARRRKRYQRLKNRKKDIRNKLVSCITKSYETIIVQDESINAWKAGGHGKKIQNTGIGGIMADLKEKSHTLIIVDRFFASTKTCSCCGFVKDKMKQSERVYVCPHCGAIMCRDMNAAKNILQEGLKQFKGKNKIAREPSEFKSTPGENGVSTSNVIDVLRNIYRVECKPCSLNQEARPPLATGSSRLVPICPRGGL